MTFIESAKLGQEILRDMTALAIDRQIETVKPEAAAHTANLLIIRYLRDVIEATDLAEQFAACVGVAVDPSQSAEPIKRRRKRGRAETIRPCVT